MFSFLYWLLKVLTLINQSKLYQKDNIIILELFVIHISYTFHSKGVIPFKKNFRLQKWKAWSVLSSGNLTDRPCYLSHGYYLFFSYLTWMILILPPSPCSWRLPRNLMSFLVENKAKGIKKHSRQVLLKGFQSRLRTVLPKRFEFASQVPAFPL